MVDTALKNLNLNSEEVGKLTKAMKDPKFMELLTEYAQEISEPTTREEAGKYLKMMEERNASKGLSMEGKDLIIPYPSFCVKTKNKETRCKVFINICFSEKIGKPTSTSRADGSGEQWAIPYSLGLIHKDKDKGGKDCQSLDFVVHEEACNQAKDNQRFKNLLVETAIEAAEKQRGLQLDPNFVLPKLKYKGPGKNPKMMTVRSSGFAEGRESVQPESAEEKESKKSKCTKEKENILNDPDTGCECLVEPKYELIYRSGLDLGKFWMDHINLSTVSEMPKEILLRVYLPLVTSAGDVNLDVSEQEVVLTALGKYHLKVALKYLVDFSKGRAQFNKSTQKLEVILPTLSMSSPKATSMDPRD